MPLNPSGDEPETDEHPCIDCGDPCDCGEVDESYCQSCSDCQRVAADDDDRDEPDEEEEPFDDPDDDDEEEG